MKKPNKRDNLNLVFSAFLVLGYIVCSYFFLTMSAAVPALEPYLQVLIFAVFGLVVFYATRVGEKVQIKRFSIWTLVIMVVPSLIIILIQLIPGMFLHDQVASLGADTVLKYSPLFILACITLGYGIPYTFLSGFESGEEEQAELQQTVEEETGECPEAGFGRYTVCDSDTEGAMLVVEDDDREYDPEHDVRISEVAGDDKLIAVGRYVVWTDAEPSEDGAEAAENNAAPGEADTVSADSTGDDEAAEQTEE